MQLKNRGKWLVTSDQPIEIKTRVIDAIFRHALSDYPSECCGVILGKKNDPLHFDVSFPCRNLQDEMHAQDSKQFPRTSQTAYFLDPKDLFHIQKIGRERGLEPKVIYHSHVDVGAYFSDEDKKQATYEGKPVYPGVFYLVIDAAKDRVRGAKLFGWDESAKDFLERALVTNH